jgi:hypothetical protein
MKMTKEKMVEKFQCPGCVDGPAPKKCKGYKLSEEHGIVCSGHVLGTSINMQIRFALGLPKGFSRAGPQDDMRATRSKLSLSLWLKGTSPVWDKFNVPVWALEEDGFLFVRTYAPRTDRGRIDVIEGGTLAMVPQAIDVKPFYEEFD